jgi:transcriptional regulator with XRE-family HTH domain
MLITGNQLKAARALAGVEQLSVAQAAKVSVNTIRNMESRGPDPITSGAVTVRNVQIALENLGVEFLNGDQPGVRMKAGYKLPPAAKPKFTPFGREPGIQTRVGNPRRPRKPE